MEPQWLSDAVIYQIYPQSFQDSNGDGIGDFQGVIKRLDYIKSIGVNVIWFNPCFDSPFGDAGYDIRDFYKVAPRYGTKEALKELFAKAHEMGIKVVLDLVAGHTSMDNQWFVYEAKNPKSPDSNRYIWKNRDFDPEKGPDRDDFVSNFFWYQPALNYGYGEVTEPWQDPVDAPGPKKNREELRSIMKYWFDLGCDGFRVDMAASLVKNDGDKRPNLNKLWHDLRSWMESEYPECALVAEWSNPAHAVEAGFHLDFMMHFNAPGYPSLFFNGTGTLPPKEGDCYFAANAKGGLKTFAEEYKKQLASIAGKGYVSLPSANHDFQRLNCGERTPEQLRCAWAFLMTQAGPVTIYYGDEIGMRFVAGTPPKEGSTLKGIIAPNAGAPDGERAGTRTPMQWDSTANNGFSTADPADLYLPIDTDENRPTVAAQDKDPDSLLNFIRNLAEIRSANPALGAKGEFTLLNSYDEPYPMVYTRELDGSKYLVVTNPAGVEKSITVDFNANGFESLCEAACELNLADNKLKVTLQPFAYGIYKVN